MPSMLIIDIVTLILFVVSIIVMVTAESTILSGLGGLFAIVWMVYLIVTNYRLLIKNQAPKEQMKQVSQRLRESDKKGIFASQIRMLSAQYDSILSRKDYFMNKQDNMQELYCKIEEQMLSNVDSAEGFMKTYDYITCPKPEYLNKLCASGDELVAKYNKLVEQLVDVDTNLTTFDATYVDDVIDCLEKVKGI